MSDALQPRIAELMAHASGLAQQGKTEAAADQWRAVLQLQPTHAQALNQLGAQALAKGRLAEADELLERAIAARPGLAIAHANLSRLRGARGDATGALQAIDAALRADPVAWGAHFERAKLLEAAGRHREAGMSWSNGLQYMPEQAQQAPQFQTLVAQARNAVQATSQQLAEVLRERMHDLRADRGHRELQRMDHTLDILSGKRSFVTARPLMLPIPRLPAIPIFDREDFDWVPAVEAAFPQVLRELQELLVDGQQNRDFVPYVQTPEGEPKGQFQALDRNLDWGAYFLWQHGRRIDAHADRCPRTEAAITQAPQIQIRDRAPVIFFSTLKPGVHIPPHNGATNARLTVHLPLVIPPDCGLRVGEETHVWEPGKLVIFDDTIRHEAWNYSDRLRVVLIFDVWHPMLTALEREIVTRTIETMMAFYGDASDLGEL